jgi:hypothetical protein
MTTHSVSEETAPGIAPVSPGFLQASVPAFMSVAMAIVDREKPLDPHPRNTHPERTLERRDMSRPRIGAVFPLAKKEAGQRIEGGITFMLYVLRICGTHETSNVYEGG